MFVKSDQEKDLGVLTTCNLLWNDQNNSCVNKANQMICFIARNLISREKSLMLRIYKTLIRPNLEYCVQLLNPVHEHGNWSIILRIEGVQRRFTRMINGIGLLPYSERLEILGLTTLAERRARGDLIEVCKAKHDFSFTNNVFKFGRSGLNLLSKFCPSSNAKCNTIKRNCLNERVREYWNKLPNDLKMAPNINSFKNRLESYKLDCISSANERPGNFSELSDAVLSRIEGANYADNKSYTFSVKFDVICHSEAHLHDQNSHLIRDRFEISEYISYKLTSTIKYGGCVVYVRNTLQSSIISNLTESDHMSDHLFINIEIPGSKKKLCVAAYYRHNKRGKDTINEFTDQLDSKLGSVNLKNKHVIVVGDMNIV